MFGPSRGEQGVCSHHFSGQGTSTQRTKCLSPLMGTPVIGIISHGLAEVPVSVTQESILVFPRARSWRTCGWKRQGLRAEASSPPVPITGPPVLGMQGPSPSLAHLYQGCRALLVTHSMGERVWKQS